MHKQKRANKQDTFRHWYTLKLFQNMTFDVNKATEVEGMSTVDFGVWKSAKQNEVIILIDDIFNIQFPIKLQCRNVFRQK